MRPFRYCFLTVKHESGWFPRLESPDSGMSRDFLCGAAGTGCLGARTVFPRPLGCRDYLRFDLLAASIRKSGLEIKNRCMDCPCFDLMAASIRKSGLEIKNRCTDCPCFDLLAASILKSGLEIGNQCKDCPCFDLFAASIRKSRLEIENRCTDCPCFDLMAASIRKSGLEIENRCSTIVPASRIARLRKPVVAVLNGPPAE